MKESEQNIAIAEWCGLKPCGYHFEYHVDRAGDRWECSPPIPVYTRDLNAMFSAEEKLTDQEWYGYQDAIFHATASDPHSSYSVRRYIHATAAQRAEALLKTIGRWKD